MLAGAMSHAALRAPVDPNRRARIGSSGKTSPSLALAAPRAHAARRAGRAVPIVTARGARHTVLAVSTDDMKVPGLSVAEQCTDFVCISSPAVEQAVRRIAKDIEGVRTLGQSVTAYAEDIKYKGPFISLEGRDAYQNYSFVQDVVQEPKTRVISMEMVQGDTAQIVWELTGKVAPGEIKARFTSKFTMNLISGRAVEHEDTWDLAGSSPAGAVFLNAARAAYGAQRGIGGAAKKAEAMISMDEEDNNTGFSVDPTDPNKFFQQQDPNSELYQIATLIGVVYLIYKVWFELAQL